MTTNSERESLGGRRPPSGPDVRFTRETGEKERR